MALVIANRYLLCAIAWVHKKFRQQGIGSLLPNGKARTIKLDSVIRSIDVQIKIRDPRIVFTLVKPLKTPKHYLNVYSCYGEGLVGCAPGVEMGLTQVSEGTNWRDGTSK